MDPDAALAELREIADQHIEELDDEQLNSHADTGRMAELILALDAWIKGGGFLPKDWRATSAAVHGGE